MALLVDDWLPAKLSGVAYIAELTFFHYPLFFKSQKA